MNKVQPHAKYRPGDVVTLKAVRASEMGVLLVSRSAWTPYLQHETA